MVPLLTHLRKPFICMILLLTTAVPLNLNLKNTRVQLHAHHTSTEIFDTCLRAHWRLMTSQLLMESNNTHFELQVYQRTMYYSHIRYIIGIKYNKPLKALTFICMKIQLLQRVSWQVCIVFGFASCYNLPLNSHLNSSFIFHANWWQCFNLSNTY